MHSTNRSANAGLPCRLASSLLNDLVELLTVNTDGGSTLKMVDQNYVFSTNSLYRKLCEGAASPNMKNIWKAQVPLKIRIFLWQLSRGRLPSSDQIALRHGPSNGQCALCGDHEDAGHIFFRCALAAFVWAGIRDMLQVPWNPLSFQDLCGILEGVSGQSRKALRVLFAAVFWSLWIIRNKFTIEGKFPNQPADCVFKTLIHLQLWRPLLKADVAPLMEELIAAVKALFDATYSRVA